MSKFFFATVDRGVRIHYPRRKSLELSSLEQGALEENLAILIKKNLKELDNESGCFEGN